MCNTDTIYLCYYSYSLFVFIGSPVLGRTVIHNQTNNIITQCGVYYNITISPRDEYGNIAVVNSNLLYLTVIKVYCIYYYYYYYYHHGCWYRVDHQVL